MEEIELCARCGVPTLIGRELRWGDNGVITLADSPRNRMVFFESNVIDNIFAGMREMLGKPVEPMVIESRRRETRRFIERSFPFEVRNTLLIGDADPIRGGSPFTKVMAKALHRLRRELSQRVVNMGKVFGYGDIVLGEGWERGYEYPWRSFVVRHPYSLPLWMADVLGTVEAFEGMDMRVESRETGEDEYLVEVRPGAHELELSGKLRRRRYDFKPGDLAYERCPECGVPEDVARYRWDLRKGTIIAADTSRRVAVLGSQAIDAVFGDLEEEFGPRVFETSIEAQRRYVKSRVDREAVSRIAPSLPALTALRGLGYVARVEGGRGKLELSIRNACMPYMLVGMAKGLYELLAGLESSRHQWEALPDGDLNLAIYA
ncbi:MAG: hypothetical protein H5T74_09265 [Actinobacteria bacterium]|nr:hypothetical protein [Actinomycetota bacterium]